jgi:glycerol-3-phosphate dehydrogenase
VVAGDHSVNNTRLVQALHASASNRGVEFRAGAAVTRIDTAKDRGVAVEAGGKRLTPKHLIIAAGAWSAEIGALFSVRIPVRTDRGEMMAVRPRTPLTLALSWRDGYLVPRADGEVLIGSTSARGATDKIVTASAAATLLGRAVRMMPALADAPLARSWAGLRPCRRCGARSSGRCAVRQRHAGVRTSPQWHPARTDHGAADHRAARRRRNEHSDSAVLLSPALSDRRSAGPRFRVAPASVPVGARSAPL